LKDLLLKEIIGIEKDIEYIKIQSYNQKNSRREPAGLD
jgi:hypothetical protein